MRGAFLTSSGETHGLPITQAVAFSTTSSPSVFDVRKISSPSPMALLTVIAVRPRWKKISKNVTSEYIRISTEVSEDRMRSVSLNAPQDTGTSTNGELLFELGAHSKVQAIPAELLHCGSSVSVFAPEVHLADAPPDVTGHGTECFKQQSPLPKGKPRMTYVHALHLESAMHADSHIFGSVFAP